MKKITLGKLDVTGGSPSQFLFKITRRDVGLAVGHPVGDAFVVLRGSHVSSSPAPNFDSPSCSTPRALRKKLLTAGVIASSGDDASLRFTQDWIFGSASTAAAVVLAASANGNDEWCLV